MDLYNKRKDKIESASRKRDMVTRNMEATNIRGAVSLESSRNKRQKTSITNSSFASTIKTSKTANSPSTTYSTPTISLSKKNKQLCQMKVYGGASVDSDLKLTMAIADFIHSCGLPFRLADHPKFRHLLQMARFMSSKYNFPSRNQISTELLDVNFDTYKNHTIVSLKKDIDIFGLSFYGDGATLRRMPLINVMASGAYLHTAVLEIVNCTKHMADGGKKDARYIASLFRPHIDMFEELNPDCVDYCTFDGAANVQKPTIQELFVLTVPNMSFLYFLKTALNQKCCTFLSNYIGNCTQFSEAVQCMDRTPSFKSTAESIIMVGTLV